MPKAKKTVAKKETSELKKVNWTKRTTGNIFKFEKVGEEFIGIFQGMKTTKWKNRPIENVQALNEEGESVLLSGTVLVRNLSELKPGTPIKIVFTGIKGKGRNKYKNFDIYTG